MEAWRANSLSSGSSYSRLAFANSSFRVEVGRHAGGRVRAVAGLPAEDEARQRGAKNAYLDTFSFQVPDFYKQHGYEVFGELPDFPPGHQRYFMKKQL